MIYSLKKIVLYIILVSNHCLYTCTDTTLVNTVLVNCRNKYLIIVCKNIFSEKYLDNQILWKLSVQLVILISLTALTLQLSPTSKVTRWFEMLQPLSRPESGFVDAVDGEGEDEAAEVTEALLRRLPGRKRRKLLGLKIGRVTTF